MNINNTQILSKQIVSKLKLSQDDIVSCLSFYCRSRLSVVAARQEGRAGGRAAGLLQLPLSSARLIEILRKLYSIYQS